MIETIVNRAAELNETHHCGRDAAFMTAALMELSEKLETFLNGPCCRETVGAMISKEALKEFAETPETVHDNETWTAETQINPGDIYVSQDVLDPLETKTEPPITLDELRKLVLATVQADKREAVAAILGHYKVKVLTEIPEKDYPDFKARLETL